MQLKPISIIKRLWNSPTFNTWVSFAVVPLNTVIFFPLLLKTFSIEEIALWFLFSLYISLQILADFGFYNTFVRVISYGYGGRTSIDFNKDDEIEVDNTKPNWLLIKKINQTMNGVYVYATIGLLVFFLLLSVTLIKPIGDIQGDQSKYWYSWGIIIIFSLINFSGKRYSNYLLGLNKVALVRRVQGIFSLLTLITNLTVLLITQSFLLLILSSQIWHIFRIIFIRWKAQNIENKEYKGMRGRLIHKDIFSSVWGPAWKGGISSFASTGTTKISGIIYAQLATSERLAEYLIALKILEVIKNVSMAPFYSKIPLLSRLFGQNNKTEWKRIAKRGMLFANVLLIAGIVFFGFFGDFIFKEISSNIVFPNIYLWYLLGFAFFFHRYGAMHTQLYMTSNKVNSHISDIVAGSLFIVSSILLFPYFNVYAFGIGMLIGYLGFYVWFAMYYSYQIISERFLNFEFKTTIIPFVLFVLSLVLSLITY